MNYSLLFNALLGGTVLVGFLIRYLAVLTHRLSENEGRLGLAGFLAAILYIGIIFASIDKVPSGNILKSFVVIVPIFLALDIALGKLAKTSSKNPQ